MRSLRACLFWCFNVAPIHIDPSHEPGKRKRTVSVLFAGSAPNVSPEGFRQHRVHRSVEGGLRRRKRPETSLKRHFARYKARSARALVARQVSKPVMQCCSQHARARSPMLVCQDGQTPPKGRVDANGQTHVAIFKGMMVVTFQIFVADQRQPDMRGVYSPSSSARRASRTSNPHSSALRATIDNGRVSKSRVTARRSNRRFRSGGNRILSRSACVTGVHTCRMCSTNQRAVRLTNLYPAKK